MCKMFWIIEKIVSTERHFAPIALTASLPTIETLVQSTMGFVKVVSKDLCKTAKTRLFGKIFLLLLLSQK